MTVGASRMLCLTGAVAVAAVCAPAAFGQPSAPSDLVVVPRYVAAIDLRLAWIDHSNNETGFRIERREQGTTAFTPVATVGPNVATYTDTTATGDKFWEYRVCAVSALGDSAYSNISHATSPRQVWPIHDGTHDLLHSFGTPLNFSGKQYFHEGIDVMAGGKQVDAARGGVCTQTFPPTKNGGELWLDVDFGGPGVEADAYMHTQIDSTWGAGDVIAPGDRIGTVSTTWFGKSPQADHVHWGSGVRNNLVPFTASADRDPSLVAPVVADINNDAQDFIVVDAANNDHSQPRDPAWGDVDLIVDGHDAMNATVNLRANPHSIGYWIQSGAPGGEDVRSASTPYRLIEFDFPLHAGAPPHADESAVYWPLDADIQGLNTWQTCFSWLLTNTRGTDGAKANVDANQFWRTDARLGTGTEPNGSDAQRARENEEARFPDGAYYVHILLSDLEHDTDAVRSVLVDNSRPYVRKVTVRSGAQIVYQADWAWDAATAQLAIQPADFDSAAAFSALRTQDVTIEVEFSEPMSSASIISISPSLGAVPTLTSTQPGDGRTTWTGMVSNLDIADDGSDDGIHMITLTATDLAGNALLEIHGRASMGPDHHSRDSAGVLRGIAGTDTIHGFRIGPPVGLVPMTAIFMKQQAADPTSPTIADKSAELQQALNVYFSEVAYGKVSFSVSGHGWYQLAHPISWYYTSPQTPLIDLVQEAITAAESNGVSMADDSYVVVVTDEVTARGEWSTTGAWPYHVAAAPGWRLIAGGTANLATTTPHVTNLAGRWVGLVDLFAYPEVTVARPFVGQWSHMSDQDHEVHVLGWEKWRAGWLDETDPALGKVLTRIPKPSVSTPIIDQTYTILPLDKGDNGTKMVAIQTADRLYYTVEYRRGQGLDSALPDSGVLIVKANDAINQGEGPAIVQHWSLTATDLSAATFNLTSSRNVFDDVGSGVKVEVTAMDDSQAQIRLNYKLPPTENDVYVSPHDDRWVTEDIWVDAPDLAGNFEADPLTVKDANEKPVVGQVNKVVARVRNQGHADATNFEVHLEIREPWGAGGPWRSLKVETVSLLEGQDSGPNDYHLVTANWTPAGDIHSCIQVTVKGVANDVNTENNWTQENISEFVTSPGSPYAPVTSRFEVENPYSEKVPVFFKVDGLPADWAYVMSPERLEIPPKGVGTAQITVQPHNEAPLCSRELITVTAFTPRVDTLKRLGAITLQVGLKRVVKVTLETRAVCEAGSSSTTHGDENPRECLIYAQGRTEPPVPNARIAVVYTSPSGQKQVHYVTADANGNYRDQASVGGLGLWQTQAVLQETSCLVEGRSPLQPVPVGGVPVSGRAWRYFAAFGPSFPVGRFADLYDPGFSLTLGAERTMGTGLSLVALVGFHQFYSLTQNQHLVEGGLGLKRILHSWPAKYTYVQGGVSWYHPRFGNAAVGANIGAGTTWVLTPQLGLDLHVGYHHVAGSGDLRDASFIPVQMGLIWSH